jgi:hypothetical protein
VGNNSGSVQAFETWANEKVEIPIDQKDAYARIRKKDGKAYRQEFYYGSNYLSQTSRSLRVRADVTSITIYDNQGNKREAFIKQP